MKRAPVTAALTLAGILTAGTATALVNSHVLDIADTQATETNRVRLPALPTTTTTPTTSAAGGVVAVTTVPEPPVLDTSSTATTPPAAETTITRIPQLVAVAAGEAGIVTVQVSPEGFQVVAATPNEGWVLDDSADAADVTAATSPATEPTTTTTTTTTTTAPPSTPAPTTAPSDDDDDGGEDDRGDDDRDDDDPDDDGDRRPGWGDDD